MVYFDVVGYLTFAIADITFNFLSFLFFLLIIF